MSKNLWNSLQRPIICLAPMDGYTDSAFRRVCKEVNPAIIVYTEFTSADGIHHGAQKVKDRFNYHPSEQPLIGQIFGKNTETFITAAKYLEEQGFAGIDINMGCPSKKVVKSEHGVALRKNHDQAFRLVAAVAENTNLPVSVKTRLGWKDASDLIEFGKGVEAAGAQAIAIHGRTYSVPYNCPADFEPIYELKRHLSIPVIANGGITSIQDGIAKLVNLDGFMIGQASFGNPWIFLEDTAEISFKERLPLIKKHLQYLIEDKGDRVALLEIRKHLVRYVKGIPAATAFRKQLVQITSFHETCSILDAIVNES